MKFDIFSKLLNRPSNEDVRVFQGKPFRIFDRFVTAKGENIPLLSGFREYLKPDWKGMLAVHDFEPSNLRPDSMRAKIEANRKKVATVDKFLKAHGYSLEGASILEVGCFMGATTFALSELHPSRIVGSDLSKYYINQSVGKSVSDENIKKAFGKLTSDRNALKEHIRENGLIDLCGDISFVEDDITASNLPSGSFDLVCGFEVMEHVKDPYSSLSEMKRLVRDGGLIFQEYNPFYCLEGGHSLCTLDFPWGHARLTGEDFTRYTRKYRPDEASVDQSFYFNNLNRMTLKDLEEMAGKLGLKVIEMIKWSNNKLIPEVLNDPAILSQCRLTNRTVSINDLISDKIWLLLQKG